MDYKFGLILILSIILFFIYNQVDKLRSEVKKINIRYTNIINKYDQLNIELSKKTNKISSVNLSMNNECPIKLNQKDIIEITKDKDSFTNIKESEDESSESESYGEKLSYDSNGSKKTNNLATYSNEKPCIKHDIIEEVNINNIMENIINKPSIFEEHDYTNDIHIAEELVCANVNDFFTNTEFKNPLNVDLEGEYINNIISLNDSENCTKEIQTKDFVDTKEISTKNSIISEDTDSSNSSSNNKTKVDNISINQQNNNIINLNNWNKLKLSKLQDMANKNNIDINKNIDNKNKIKTKKELYIELQKFLSINNEI